MFTQLSQTVQRLMLSKGAKITIFYHITETLQYCLDKKISRSGDMLRDYVGTLTVSASQTLRYKIAPFEFPLF